MEVVGVCWLLIGSLSLLFGLLTERGSHSLGVVQEGLTKWMPPRAALASALALAVCSCAVIGPVIWVLVGLGLEPGRGTSPS